MNFLAIIEAIASLIPSLINIIQSVEAAIPSASGSAKLAVVVNTLQAANSAATNALPSFTTIIPAIQSTVSGIVSAFNAAGIFKHASATAAPATPAASGSTVAG